MDKAQENKIITEAIEKSGIKIIVIPIAMLKYITVKVARILV